MSKARTQMCRRLRVRGGGGEKPRKHGVRRAGEGAARPAGAGHPFPALRGQQDFLFCALQSSHPELCSDSQLSGLLFQSSENFLPRTHPAVVLSPNAILVPASLFFCWVPSLLGPGWAAGSGKAGDICAPWSRAFRGICSAQWHLLICY